MPNGRPRIKYRFAPPHVWAEVRRDYCAGLTAKACCTRHGVGEAALRRRATLEGWTKAATRAEPASGAQPAPPPSLRTGRAPIDPMGVARGALERASAALLDGRPAEAEAIMRALDLVLPMAELFGDDDKAAGELAHLCEQDPDRFGGIGRMAERLAEELLDEIEVPPAHAEWAATWRAARAARVAARGEGEAGG